MNRCEVPALQRKDLERTAKEQPCSLQTVGYGWVRMGSGGWKRVVLESNKKGLCKRKALGLCKSVVFEGNSQGFLKIKNFLVCKSR